MAKIDTSKIENYDSLSDEEKLKALLDFDFVSVLSNLEGIFLFHNAHH